MTIKNFILFCLPIVFLFTSNVQGQTKFDLPQNITLQTKQDYAQYEPAVIDAAKWLETTDLNQEPEKRKQVSTFIIKWISGSPNVTVNLSEGLSNVIGDNSELLIIYLASYARYYLENKTTATDFLAAKAGLTSIMKVYKKGIGVKKVQEMEQISKLGNENKLDDYIKNNIL